MSSEPRKHHYLPEFYSKWWAGADRRLIRYTKPTTVKMDIKRVYPSEVGWQKDLYSFLDRTGNRSQVTEIEFFKKLDDKAARALRRLNSTFDVPLSVEESNVWTLFIQSLLLRSPTHIESFKQKAGVEFEKSLPDVRLAYPGLRKLDDPETFDEYEQQKGKFNINNIAMQIFPRTIVNSNIGKFIHEMFWAYRIVPNDSHKLLLSDDPVIRTNGLRKKDGHLVLPLSPNRLFIATWQQSTMIKLDQIKTTDLVRMTNHAMVCGARQFVIASDTVQTRFIERRFGSMPRPSIAG